jgi:predicted Co/Zn/Cd cation transporter (cation efflux family)
MNDQNSRSERQVLLISAAGNLIIGLVGILFAVFSRSQAIMLDAVRTETLKELKTAHLATVLDMVFTADPVWGAPAGLDALNSAEIELSK